MGKKRKASTNDNTTLPQPAKKRQKSHIIDSTKPAQSTTPLDTSPFLNNPKGADLKREVQLYDTLSSESRSERLAAANAVVSGLLGGDGVEESTLQRHLERRLFRGLASGRKGARLGFSVVLTEILGQLFGEKDLSSAKYSNLTFEKVLAFLVAKTKAEGDLSGQEEKDHYLGLLFGLQCFVRAKVLFDESQRWTNILGRLLDLSKKKPWIREECGWVIVEALSYTSQVQAEHTLEQLQESGLAASPEGVGIWITARNRFPEMKFPSKPWGSSGKPLDHLKTIAKALKESSANDDESNQTKQAKQTGSWNPQLHFVWDVVLSQYASDASTDVEGVRIDFDNFWKVSVDENLFSATASPERKFWGFLLFQKILHNTQSYGNFFPSVFSHNLVRCLINHVQEQDRFLHGAAEKSLKTVIQTVEAHPEMLAVVLPHLIGRHGTYNFDKITKTKAVEKLLKFVDETNAKTIIGLLTEPAVVVQGDNPEREAELRRLLLGDYILSIIRRVNMTESTQIASWIKDTALANLAEVAYTSHSAWQPALSEKTRIIFQNRLMSAFSHLLSDLSAYSFPCELLSQFSPTAVSMDAALTDVKNHALSTLSRIQKKIRKAEDKGKAPLQALALLYSLVIFQLYNGESEAVSILDELGVCYDKLIRHKGSENVDSEASEVLVELLLSFISKPSALLRRVTQHVFSAFISDVTAAGLKLMTDVLESKENLRGQQELFDQEPEDAEKEGDFDQDSDVETVDMEADEGSLNGQVEADDSEEAEEEEDISEDEANDEASKQLDAALAAALGTRPLDPTTKDDASSSDADMTDSEMMAIDTKLVEIFSQRKKEPNKKKENKEARETMVNFKMRIVDLLDIYVKKQAENPLAFALLIPLLRLMRSTKTKELAKKAHDVIIAFAKAAKKGSASVGAQGLDLPEQIKLLEEIHVEASKDPSHVFAKAASTASLSVASSLYRADNGNLKKIAKVYMESQLRWVQGEVRMQAAFFVEWINWCQSHANQR